MQGCLLNWGPFDTEKIKQISAFLRSALLGQPNAFWKNMRSNFPFPLQFFSLTKFICNLCSSPLPRTLFRKKAFPKMENSFSDIYESGWHYFAPANLKIEHSFENCQTPKHLKYRLGKSEFPIMSYLVDKVQNGCQDLTISQNNLLFQLQSDSIDFGLKYKTNK